MIKATKIAISVAVIFSTVMAAEAQAESCGGASWYALNSRTASGEPMKHTALTAAHRSLAFGTKLKVTNKRNGKSVIVRINDRGPFTRGRVLDVSKGAAQVLDLISAGHGQVCYSVVKA